ncbi:MAG: hypothetical protein HYX63_01420 [Gammaproteobacteria bacterium]|nr:hypothetical protein [Gammaproteobacteria bacterium]
MSKRTTHATRYEAMYAAATLARGILEKLASVREIPAPVRVDCLTAADQLSHVITMLDEYHVSGEKVAA